jgi:hypothetical protein
MIGDPMMGKLSTAPDSTPTRRDFLYLTTGFAGVVETGFAYWLPHCSRALIRSRSPAQNSIWRPLSQVSASPSNGAGSQFSLSEERPSKWLVTKMMTPPLFWTQSPSGGAYGVPIG